MKQQSKKILGEERRELILKWLMDKEQPITGTHLASKTNVSRQVIVQDISLLKARNYPILATAQGYVYMKEQTKTNFVSKVVACKHLPEQTEDELNIIVDFGGIVKDVVVEHPVYGDLTASLMLRNRRDVKEFITRMATTKAALLSQLTDGVHLHTIEARNISILEEICQALEEAGFLLKAEDS
ncbi:transcription repressor NadR [Anaerobacillus alkaliphilus]|uniref:Transcription repressor NadR n=1 Tax=Anaerobacillus alkaliphilus TaxID=1548597 RepID=A0A4Q0VRC0_9BACI|nr:transcription repressor NadR [Anaerobacillus alkaliphilus]RXI99913.1 transcription repressor NadR [Anaerobacillus alkaliphilus]